MKRIPIAEKRKEALLLQARESFKGAIRASAYIINSQLAPADELYYPLTTAVYVLYSRPFLKNYGIGRLEDIIVPKKSLELHREILAYRNKVFAHRDLAVGTADEIASEESLHATYVTVRGGWLYSQVVESTPDVDRIREIHDLGRALLEKVRYHSGKFFQRYHSFFPRKDATYKFQIFSAGGPDFVIHDPVPVADESFSTKLPRRIN